MRRAVQMVVELCSLLLFLRVAIGDTLRAPRPFARTFASAVHWLFLVAKYAQSQFGARAGGKSCASV